MRIKRSLALFAFVCLVGSIVRLSANDLRVEPNHPVYQWLSRYEYLVADQLFFSTRPHTEREIITALRIIQHSDELGSQERQINESWLQWFGERANTQNLKSQLSGDIFYYNARLPRPHLIYWSGANDTLWVDLNEMTRVESSEKDVRILWQDGIVLSARLGQNGSFYMDGYRYMYQGQEGFSSYPEEFHGGYLSDHAEGVSYREFEKARAYVQYHSDHLGLFTLAKYPIVWGAGSRSVTLSENAPAFPWFGWEKPIGNSRFTFFHGALLNTFFTQDSLTGEKTYPQKYIVGHRWQFLLAKQLELSFSEVYIYGNRPVQPDYLIPPILLFVTEHDLQDRDNATMAVELNWSRRRANVYLNLFLDELRFSELFSGWWANKHAIQAGAQFKPTIMAIPALLTIEVTAVRPWTYTHKYDYNSYTHQGVGLGFEGGPNSQMLFIESQFFISPRLSAQLSSKFLRHGLNTTTVDDPEYFPIGNDPNENYNDRNPDNDYSTDWLMGQIQTRHTFRASFNYRLSQVLYIKASGVFTREADFTEDIVSLQLNLNY